MKTLLAVLAGAAVVVFVPLVCALYVLTAELVQVWREDHEPDDAGDDLPPGVPIELPRRKSVAVPRRAAP